MTRLTILGSTGFIGSHLVAEAQSRGLNCDTPLRGANLQDKHLGHVIYAIGLTADFRKLPFETVEAHITYLSDILKKTKFDSFLYLSSTRVYGNNDPLKLVDENTPLQVDSNNPSDLYNLSKLMGESLTLQSQANTRVVRLSNVYGCNDRSSNFLNAIMQEAIYGHILLQTTVGSYKDYVAVEDVVAAILHIAINGKHRMYNVASGMNTSHQALVDPLAQLTGCTVSVAENAPRSVFPLISIQKLTSEFQFTPRSVVEALPRLIEAAKQRLS